MSPPVIGAIHMTDFGDPIGHEQGFRRPAVVVSPQRFNSTRSQIVVVVPVTSRDRGIPSHIALSHKACGLDRPSWVRTEDLRSVSQRRLGKYLGRIAHEELSRIRETISMLLEL